MGQHLGLHRKADKSAGERAIVKGDDGKPVQETVLDAGGNAVTRDQREPWPLTDVELTSDPPTVWEPSDRFVSEGLAEVANGAPAWIELTKLRPHATRITLPSGPQAGAEQTYPRGMVFTGDQIVLKLTDARRDKRGVPVKSYGKRITLRYDVLEAPGIYLDADEPSGYRISHGYRTKLAKGD